MFRICTFNVRSLVERSRRIDLSNLINCNNIDFAFIQETHLKSNHKVYLDNYNFIRDFTTQGVGIAIRKKYSFSKIIIPGISFPNIFIEIHISINNQIKKILIGSIYIPCNLNPSQFENGLTNIANFSRTFDALIIGGDFNSKNISWGDNFNNLNGNTFSNWLNIYSHSFVRLCNDFPSFPNGCSFLDHFLLSSNIVDLIDPNFNVESLPTFSDHFPLILNLNFFEFDFILNHPKSYLSFKNTNWDVFKNDLTLKILQNFPPFAKNLSKIEIDFYINTYTSAVNECVDFHSDKIELSTKKFKTSDFVRKLFRIKYLWQKELRIIYRRTLDRHNYQYRIISKQIQLLNIIIKERVSKEYIQNFSERLENIKPGPLAHKKIFNILGYKHRTSLGDFTVNGLVIDDDNIRLDILKNHFSEVYRENLLERDTSDIDLFLASLDQNVLFSFDNSFSALNYQNCDKFTNLDNIICHSRELNNKKSAGIDKISNFIIKKFPIKAFEFLVIIFNNCLNNAYFPDSWKISKIVPIKKRPIVMTLIIYDLFLCCQI